jgi:hypothetical protein
MANLSNSGKLYLGCSKSPREAVATKRLETLHSSATYCHYIDNIRQLHYHKPASSILISNAQMNGILRIIHNVLMRKLSP